MWEKLIPMATEVLGGSGGGSGGGGGLLSGLLGGGKTEVHQNVSQSSNSSLGFSLTNLIGAGQAGPNTNTIPVTQSPLATSTSTPSPDSSAAPVYGQTFGPDYTTGAMSDELVEPVQASFSPVMIVGMLGLAAFLFFNSKDG